MSDKPQAREHLDEALDQVGSQGGTVSVDRERSSTEVDVVEADRIGVRVRGVRVRRHQQVDVEREARSLPERVRSLPERVDPVEVAPSLGGARLRSRPREGRYFEVDVEPGRTDIRRTEVGEDGERRAADWTMTRDQLDRLIDEVEGPGEGAD